MNTIEVEKLANHYQSLKTKIALLECQLKPVKEELEMILLENGEPLELEPFKLTLSECEREVFNLKKAKEALGIDILKDFISMSYFTQLRITAQKAMVQS